MHHLHLRRRRAANLEPFPARTGLKRILDSIVLTIGVVGPLTAVPQVLKIYLLQDASGLSGVSWLLWAIMDIPWILYGIAHRERPIVLTYFLWFIVNTSVVFGSLLYGSGLF